MHGHDVPVHADEGISPLEGVESAEGERPGQLSVGDIVISQGRATGLREAKKIPLGTTVQTQVVFQFSSPESRRSGYIY